MALTRVCVFAGARPGDRPAYLEAARALGETLARRSIGLVTGGGGIGMMGAVADGALAHGGEVIGILPEHLREREPGHPGLTELRIVPSMHVRKAMMADLSQAFISLPGGIGTLEETVEALTWTALGIHGKPLGLLDVAGYYQPLLRFLDHAVDEGFLSADGRALVTVAGESASLIEALDRRAVTLAR